MALDFRKLLAEERRKTREALEKSQSAGAQGSCKEPVARSAKNERNPPLTTSSSSTVQIDLDKHTEGFSLHDYKLDTLPSLYYVPDFIGDEAEALMLRCVEEGAWQTLRSRKLQVCGRMPPSAQPSSGSEGREDKESDSESFPRWLQQIADQLCARGVFPAEISPNNVLINQYEKDQGIMHHTDGPSYASYVVIFSLGSDCVMTFRPKLSSADIGVKSSEDVLSVLLRRKSLLVFKDSLYEDFMHGIHAEEEVQTVGEHAPCVNMEAARCYPGEKITRDLRTSITFRKVL